MFGMTASANRRNECKMNLSGEHNISVYAVISAITALISVETAIISGITGKKMPMTANILPMTANILGGEILPGLFHRGYEQFHRDCGQFHHDASKTNLFIY